MSLKQQCDSFADSLYKEYEEHGRGSFDSYEIAQEAHLPASVDVDKIVHVLHDQGLLDINGGFDSDGRGRPVSLSLEGLVDCERRAGRETIEDLLARTAAAVSAGNATEGAIAQALGVSRARMEDVTALLLDRGFAQALEYSPEGRVLVLTSRGERLAEEG